MSDVRPAGRRAAIRLADLSRRYAMGLVALSRLYNVERSIEPEQDFQLGLIRDIQLKDAPIDDRRNYRLCNRQIQLATRGSGDAIS